MTFWGIISLLIIVIVVMVAVGPGDAQFYDDFLDEYQRSRKD